MYRYTTPTLVSNALIQDWVQAERERGKKAKAFDTPFRYSSAGDCARYLSYASLDTSMGSDMDSAGVWVTGLGTRIHEWLQEALVKRYPNAKLEVPTNLQDIISGHCDAVIPASDMEQAHPGWDGGDVLYELKSMGMSRWDRQTGLKRRAKEIKNPEGPAIGTILQAGLNALANDCQTVIVGAISLEAVSKGIAEAMGFSDDQRFIAEWQIPEHVWRPAAEQELRRLSNIKATLDSGFLEDRTHVTETTGYVEHINVDRYWKCNGYCAYADQCKADGEGVIPIPEENQ